MLKNSVSVHVVVALILEGDKVLIALRPDHLHKGGYWEFPGGKVDKGEQPQDALVREIKEELAMTVLESEPLFQIYHDYPEKSVVLDIWEVSAFEGEATGNEGQQIRWVNISELDQYQFPEANAAIIKHLVQS